uniref:Uncharacterized protein n=1 Tax=Rhodnius prolixus TaxID=13249 RepID=T1I3C2_RHOPR
MSLWTSATTIRVNNDGTTGSRVSIINTNNSSQLLPARERLKRLIPYMTFYLSPAGGQHRTLQNRPAVLAVPAKDGYLQFPQQSPPPAPPPFLVPVVVQPQPYHRQPLAHYPRIDLILLKIEGTLF